MLRKTNPAGFSWFQPLNGDALGFVSVHLFARSGAQSVFSLQTREALVKGRIFSDIRKEGIVLYELVDEPLAEPKLLAAEERSSVAQEHFNERHGLALSFMKVARFCISEKDLRLGAFELHQCIEQAYSCVILTLTNYAPASHNVKFLRSLGEEQDLRLVEAFPRDHHRQRAWFNTINEAYVKARYSKHFEISEEALVWLGERTAHLLELVRAVCDEHIQKLERDVSRVQT